MDADRWIPKSELTLLLEVSPKTIQRRISDLDAHFVRREGNQVWVAREALSRGLLGKTHTQLSEELERSEAVRSVLEDDNARLQAEMEKQRLQALVDRLTHENEQLRQEVDRQRKVLAATFSLDG